MYEDRQNQSERIIYSWEFKSAIAMLFRAKAGMPGLLIYLYVKWRLGFPHYLTKQKNLDKIRQCINGKVRVRNGSKNQEQSIKKIRQRKFNSAALARKSGKAPQVRLLTK